MEKTIERTRETREDTSRSRSERPKAWTPPTALPEYSIDGFHLRWVRRALKGVEDDQNVLRRIREGYDVVRPEEVGAVNMPTLETGKHAGAVISGDLILMKIPEAMAAQRNKYYHDRAVLMQRAADQELDAQDSETMPISRNVRDTVSTGRRPPIREDDD